MVNKGDRVYASCIVNGEVITESAIVAGAGAKLVRIEGAGRAFHWKCAFPTDGPGYSTTPTEALEALLFQCEADVVRAREWLARTESTRDLVMATIAGERSR